MMSASSLLMQQSYKEDDGGPRWAEIGFMPEMFGLKCVPSGQFRLVIWGPIIVYWMKSGSTEIFNKRGLLQKSVRARMRGCPDSTSSFCSNMKFWASTTLNMNIFAVESQFRFTGGNAFDISALRSVEEDEFMYKKTNIKSMQDMQDSHFNGRIYPYSLFVVL